MQQELFQAQTTWFHVFKSMVESGDIARMGPGPTTVYLVIKAYTNWQDGRSFPSLLTIADKTGFSVRQVQRHIRVLVDNGYVSREHGRGTSNTYHLREKVILRNGENEPAAVATWDYLPSTVKAAVAEIRNLALKGDFAGVKIVNIERLQVNIGQLALGNVTQLQGELARLPAEIRGALEKAIKASKTVQSGASPA